VGRFGYFLIGGLVGAAASAVYTYLFAPAKDATLDSRYRSRWDWAIDEGNRAANAQAWAMRQDFERAKLPPPPAENLPPQLPDSTQE
jgi:gas vesicle protein